MGEGEERDLLWNLPSPVPSDFTLDGDKQACVLPQTPRVSMFLVGAQVLISVSRTRVGVCGDLRTQGSLSCRTLGVQQS